MNKKIKAVIFDVGGVLALSKNPIIIRRQGNRTFGVHEFIARKLKISLDQWFDSIDTEYSDSIEGKISKEKVLSIISKNVKTPKRKLQKIILKAYKKNFKQNKKLYKFAFKLKKQGYKIAILSDQWYLSKQALLPEKISKKFDKIIISCDIGVRKPNLKIYKILLKKLNLPAENCLFIDNQEWNLKPAKKLGMKTILFLNNKQLFRQLSKKLK